MVLFGGPDFEASRLAYEVLKEARCAEPTTTKTVHRVAELQHELATSQIALGI